MKRLFRKIALILYSIIWICQMPASLMMQKLERGLVTHGSLEESKKSAEDTKESTEDADSIEIPVFDEKPIEEEKASLPATASNSDDGNEVKDELADSLLQPMNQLASEDMEETDEGPNTSPQSEHDASNMSEAADEVEEDTDTIVQPDNTSSNEGEMADDTGQDNNDGLETDPEDYMEADDWDDKKYDDDDDDISSLFKSLEDTTINPRDELIALLPNTSGEDLIEEAVGVTTIIRRWQQY